MFSNRDGIHIPVSGGPSWVRVPMNSNYPSQEIGRDGNMYAPLSEVNRPRPSAPVAYTGRDINTELSIQRYNEEYQRRQYLEEQERKQQEALINKQLDMAASAQYNIMDKLYIHGGLDEMRKEYYRLCGGTEGSNSVYARAAYNALCAKEKEEVPIREETTSAANKYYNTGGIDGLKHLVDYYRSCGDFKYASVAQSILSAKEKEEITHTPEVTKGANEYYDTGGMDSLRHLVKYYEENNYPVHFNIAKRILKQKEEQEQERERTKQLLAKAEKEIEGLILQEINLQMPGADEEQLRKIIREKLEEYPTPESRMEFIETLPDNVRLRAIQYTLPESSDGYQVVSAALALKELTILISAISIFAAEYYRDSVRNGQSTQSQERFDESVYEPLEHSLDADYERNRGVYEGSDLSLEERLTRSVDGYQPGGSHGANMGNTTPGFIPVPRHNDQGPGGYEPGIEHNADIGNSTPGFMPMYNDRVLMEQSIKSRIKDAQLPAEGKIRFIPDPDYHPSNKLLKGENGGYLDKFGNEWTKGPSRTPGEPFEWDVQLSEKGKKQLGWASRDGDHINVSLKGHITHK